MESESKFMKKEDISEEILEKEIRTDIDESIFGNNGRERYKAGGVNLFAEESVFDKAEKMYQEKIKNEKYIEEIKQRIIDSINRNKQPSDGITAEDELYKANRGILKDHLNQKNKAA